MEYDTIGDIRGHAGFLASLASDKGHRNFGGTLRTLKGQPVLDTSRFQREDQ